MSHEKHEYQVVFTLAGTANLDVADWEVYRTFGRPEIAEQVAAAVRTEDGQKGLHVWGTRHRVVTIKEDPVQWSLPTERTGRLEEWLDSQGLSLCRSVPEDDHGRTNYRNVELNAAEYDDVERRIGIRVPAPHDERGPFPGRPEPPHCGAGCTAGALWGATGVLPPNHFWYWETRHHSAGYLAHEDAPVRGTPSATL